MSSPARLMWNRYKVELQITNRLMAGIPKNPKLIEGWLAARTPTEVALARRRAAGEEIISLPDLADRVAREVDADEEAISLGFKKDEQGLYIDASNLKAHLKDCANVLQGYSEVKAFRAKLADRVYVEEDRIYLNVMEADGEFEHPVHVMTQQGPRSALKRNDYVERPVLSFTLRVLADGLITQELLSQCFEYGGTHGTGAERGLDFGRYEVLRMEVV